MALTSAWKNRSVEIREFLSVLTDETMSDADINAAKCRANLLDKILACSARIPMHL